MAMLPAPGTAEDARREAQESVNRLFALLMDRAGQRDPGVRVVHRDEIASVLGVAVDLTARHRWPGDLHGRYVERAGALQLDDVGTPMLEDLGEGAAYMRSDASRQTSLPVMEMVRRAPALLVGRTGEGKSTACRVLVRDAAAEGRPVLLAHAEAYLPGRLAALAADALSDLLDEPMPVATGVQALADPDVTLIIDGVSEVPGDLRKALAADLRSRVASGRGASVGVVGRDLASLRAVLPTSRTPTQYTVVRLDYTRRLDTAYRLVTGKAPAVGQEVPQHVRNLSVQAEHALKDAAGNPLLFTMAVRLLNAGVSFTNRAGMYAAFVEQLAARTGTEGITQAARVLGVVFAQLLDRGRRYADPYEWQTLLADAAAKIGFGLDPVHVDEAVRRAGLVSTIGFSQTVVPMHDSFADYLAGVVHASGLVPMPPRLEPADEQRVAFTAEIGGVDADLAAAIARDLPFLAVSLARFDLRPVDVSGPAEVAALLGVLAGASRGVALWRDGDRVVAFANEFPSRWVHSDEAQLLAQSHPFVVGTGGPLDLTVRLWRRELRVALTPPRVLPPARPRTADEAVGLLRTHTAATADALDELLDELPTSARVAVRSQIGPVGLAARVSRQQEDRDGADWPVTYANVDSIDIAVAEEGAGAPDTFNGGGSSAVWMLSAAPSAESAKLVMDAVNELVGHHWL